MNRFSSLVCILIFALLGAISNAQDRPEDTEVWSPVPPIVTPAPYVPSIAPSDAVVLFDGSDLAEWASSANGMPAQWTVVDGAMLANGAGDIKTRRKFRDYQLHLEWRVPAGVTGSGQGRGNSGVFLASTAASGGGYEIQILDSFQNETYVNGQAGAIYKQVAPLVNAMRPPGEWQTYDIVWTAPRFAKDGSLKAPAFATIFHNGVLIQKHAKVLGETVYKGEPSYEEHGPAPIRLQDAGQPVSFRNIWIREIASH